MEDFFNFKDSLVVAQDNLLWLILALVLGVIVGWVTCRRASSHNTGA